MLGAIASERAATMARAVKRTLQPHRVARALLRALRRAQPRMAWLGATAISAFSSANARFAPVWVNVRGAKARKMLTDGYPPCPNCPNPAAPTNYSAPLAIYSRCFWKWLEVVRGEIAILLCTRATFSHPLSSTRSPLQGYLAHKNPPPPGTLQ